MMKDKSKKIITSLLIFIFALISGCSSNSSNLEGEQKSLGNSENEVIELTLSHHAPPDHQHIQHGPRYFMDLVEEKSNGRVKFIEYPNLQAGALNDQINLVQNGVVDIAITSPQHNSEKMPIGNATSLPGWDLNPYELGLAYHKLISNPDSLYYTVDFERHNLVPLFANAVASYQIVTKGKEIVTADDINGLMIRSAGGTADLIIDELGATPVKMPTGEAYEAIQRGTIDGLFIGLDSLFAYGLEEVVDQATINLQLSTFLVAYSMNKNKWDSLPEDIKEIFNEAATETVEHFGEAMIEIQEESNERLKEAGGTLHELSEADLSKINEKMQNVVKRWEDQINSQGYPAADAILEFEEAIKQVRQEK